MIKRISTPALRMYRNGTRDALEMAEEEGGGGGRSLALRGKSNITHADDHEVGHRHGFRGAFAFLNPDPFSATKLYFTNPSSFSEFQGIQSSPSFS
jgi:hypothetical protein